MLNRLAKIQDRYFAAILDDQRIYMWGDIQCKFEMLQIVFSYNNDYAACICKAGVIELFCPEELNRKGQRVVTKVAEFEMQIDMNCR